MVSTFTDNLRLNKQGDNDNPNTWGLTLNNGVIELVEEAISGIATINVTGTSNINIASTTANGATDDARHAILKLTGVLGANIDLIVPTVEKVYIIWGAHTGGTVTVKPTGGSGVTIEPDDVYIIFTDGTDANIAARPVDPDLFLQVANNLSDLDDVSDARDNLGLGDLATEDYADVLLLVKQAIYPVGSLYFNGTSATNPSSLLGFGTWEAYAAGRVLVGVGTGTDVNTTDQSFTLGATGGEYTHGLTIAEIDHVHESPAVPRNSDTSGVSSSIGLTAYSFFGSSGNLRGYAISGGVATVFVNLYTLLTGRVQDGVFNGGTLSSTITRTRHNNVQPYIAVHVWRRTA